MLGTIKVNYTTAHTLEDARALLEEVGQSPMFAWDLEVASKYTEEDLTNAKRVFEDLCSTKKDKIHAQAILKSNALGHPSHCTVTHCSLATSESTGYVITFGSEEIRKLTFDFLTSCSKTQILHNASYDFKHLYYHTKKFPENYEDTQILAKTLINHVDIMQARTGLKELAGKWYGDWAISADNFNIYQMYEEKVLRYAAIDACATFKLWEYTNSVCKDIDDYLITEYCKTVDCDPPPDWL